MLIPGDVSGTGAGIGPHACLRLSLEHSDDHFSLGMSLSIVPDRFSNLIQRVTSIDDGYHTWPASMISFTILLLPVIEVNGPRSMAW